MEFLQYLNNPYAVIGLIVFVVASALGMKSKAATRGTGNTAKLLFFGVALAGLATTIAVAWFDMQKTTGTAESVTGGTTVNAEGGSNVVTGVDASGSSTVNINQGKQSQ